MSKVRVALKTMLRNVYLRSHRPNLMLKMGGRRDGVGFDSNTRLECRKVDY
jgi:hypothetical protein